MADANTGVYIPGPPTPRNIGVGPPQRTQAEIIPERAQAALDWWRNYGRGHRVTPPLAPGQSPPVVQPYGAGPQSRVEAANKEAVKAPGVKTDADSGGPPAKAATVPRANPAMLPPPESDMGGWTQGRYRNVAGGWIPAAHKEEWFPRRTSVTMRRCRKGCVGRCPRRS